MQCANAEANFLILSHSSIPTCVGLVIYSVAR